MADVNEMFNRFMGCGAYPDYRSCYQNLEDQYGYDEADRQEFLDWLATEDPVMYNVITS